MRDDWRFLDEWFRTLKDAACIHDASLCDVVQDVLLIGCDDTELWIDLRLFDVEVRTAAQRTARCRLLHEALVLTSIVAIADYDAWRDAITSVSELGIPAAGVPDTMRRHRPPQYRLELPSEFEYTWAHVKQLVASDQLSDRFREHHAMAIKTVCQYSVRLDSVKRLSVHVSDFPETMGIQAQIAWIQSLTDAITTSQHLESEPTSQHLPLRLDSIALSLQGVEIHSSVFDAILALVETGVRIKSLSMPVNFPGGYAEDQPACYERWGLLLCAPCDRPLRPTRGPVHVEKLVLGSAYDFPDMLLQLFSMLSEARTLQSLNLCASSL